MPLATVIFGAILIVQGLYGYFGSAAEKPSPTALIPLFFGAPLLLCGLLAMKASLYKHAMHAAAAIGLLGLLAAGGRGLMKIGVLFSDEPEVNKKPVIMVLLMAAICLVFIGLCVSSFISARRRKAASAGET